MSNPEDKDSPLDWNAEVVFNRTFRTVDAVCMNRLHPITFGETMWLLGHYYNHAWVTPEINSAGVAALGALTGKSSYPPYTRTSNSLEPSTNLLDTSSTCSSVK